MPFSASHCSLMPAAWFFDDIDDAAEQRISEIVRSLTVTFLVSLVFAARHGWKHATARRLRIVAGIFGLVCALLGVSLVFFSE